MQGKAWAECILNERLDVRMHLERTGSHVSDVLLCGGVIAYTSPGSHGGRLHAELA